MALHGLWCEEGGGGLAASFVMRLKVGSTVDAGTENEAIVLEEHFGNGLPCGKHGSIICQDCHRWWYTLQFVDGTTSYYNEDDFND